MLARLAVALIRLYQVTLSRFIGRVCRFEPSCSRYAVACLEGHGFVRGGLLSLRRVCKCHPFHSGGYDPPPLPLHESPRPAPESAPRAATTVARPRAAD